MSKRPQARPRLTYRLIGDALQSPRAIQCLVCGRVSHNPNDVAEKYCGYCRVFHEDAAQRMNP
jgi:hypothetical protein